ncbi:MAG: YggS family pyridoxal phosphate-dependent enzyme [Chitinophagaceae bacterium]
MPVNTQKYKEIRARLGEQVKLVAVSKMQSVEDIKSLYDLGQRDFGENYVQELLDKQQKLPADIRWHFIGHLQSNKVKFIVPIIYLIQGIDSPKLLAEVNRQAIKSDRVADVLLQVHIAQEETKFGLGAEELDVILERSAEFSGVRICGLMGMASFSDNMEKIQNELQFLKSLYEKYRSQGSADSSFSLLSMGMSSDYELAVQEGSNMVRIGSLLFGKRG